MVSFGYMRYKGIKGKFYAIFSEFIRKRDFKKYKGQCIACGKTKLYSEIQCGHFCPASNCGFSLLFDEENCNGECAGCNAFDEGHLIRYRQNLITRIGEEKVKDLERRYDDHRYKGKTMKQWTKREYEAKILEYKEKLCKLEKTDQ